MVPGEDKAQNSESVPGKKEKGEKKKRHMVSGAKTVLLFGPLTCKKRSINTCRNPGSDNSHKLCLQYMFMHRLLSFFYQSCTVGTLRLPLWKTCQAIRMSNRQHVNVFRRGGADDVPGQKQAGQEARQRNAECGSPSSAGLVLLHRPRRHDEEAARDPNIHQCHQGGRAHALLGH